MSGNTLNDGQFSVTIEGRFNLDNRPITCPRCGADRGLTFVAFVYDQVASAKCPSGHIWDERRVSGGVVRNIYRTNTGR